MSHLGPFDSIAIQHVVESYGVSVHEAILIVHDLQKYEQQYCHKVAQSKNKRQRDNDTVDPVDERHHSKCKI